MCVVCVDGQLSCANFPCETAGRPQLFRHRHPSPSTLRIGPLLLAFDTYRTNFTYSNFVSCNTMLERLSDLELYLLSQYHHIQHRLDISTEASIDTEKYRNINYRLSLYQPPHPFLSPQFPHSSCHSFHNASGICPSHEPPAILPLCLDQAKSRTHEKVKRDM